MSDSLRLHGMQHTRPPCPSPTPRDYSNSCPLSRWSEVKWSEVKLFSHIQLCASPWAVAYQAPRSMGFFQARVLEWVAISFSRGFPDLALPHCRQMLYPLSYRYYDYWVGDAIQISHPLLSPSPPTFNLSQHQGLFKWVGTSHQVTRVLKFQFHPSNEYSGLISFSINWFDLLTVQGTRKSLLQCHSSRASILWCSAFFIVQLSNLYMILEKP